MNALSNPKQAGHRPDEASRLITAIKAGMPTDGTSGVSGVSGTSAVDGTEIAEKIAAAKGRPQGPPPGPPPGGPKGEMGGLTASQSKLDQISALLDTDSDEVSSISSAQQLVSMLKDKGVDLTSLRSVLDSGDLLDVSA